MATITGTFSGTGNSAEIVGSQIAIDMTFAGTATVNVQWKVDGANWRTIEAFTASAQRVFESPGIPMRLNCSAHTNNVTYAMATF